MAWGLSGCTCVNGTGMGDWDKNVDPILSLLSHISNPKECPAGSGSRKHHRQAEIASCPCKTFRSTCLAGGQSKQAEGPRDLQIAQEDVAWDRQAPKESSGDPRPWRWPRGRGQGPMCSLVLGLATDDQLGCSFHNRFVVLC